MLWHMQSPPSITENNHGNFPCNEILCRDQRLWNTHTEKRWRDSPHQTTSTIRVWCQWHDVSECSRPWENIRPQLHVSSEIWEWLKSDSDPLDVTCPWIGDREEKKVEEQNCHSRSLACTKSIPCALCVLVVDGKMSVDGNSYFQSKPTGGCPGTI